jgi:hypothetical protein
VLEKALGDSRKMSLTKALVAIWVIAGIATATPARATIVFDNFGPGNSYQSGGFQVAGTGSVGMRFTPSSSGFFSLLKIAAGTTGSPPTPYQVSLRADNGGVPGGILETLNFDVTTTFGTNNAPTVVAASGATFLDSQATYWLFASPRC